MPAGSRGNDSWKSLAVRLEAQIPERMKSAVVPGLSIALVDEGSLAWQRAFGVKDNASQAAVDDDTVFEVASVSKTVFAYAVMKLHERGVIDFDTPLTRYTPNRYVEGDPRLHLITARHVLSHTCGFQDWRTTKEPLQIHFSPGERFLYSGEGYEYLQSVVTQLTGHVDPWTCAQYEAGLRVCATDIDAYMRKNLLGPFGMDSSGYVWNDVFEKHAARPHDREGKPLTKAKPSAADAARYAAAGGLHTTPGDYARFLIEIIDARAGDAFRLTKGTRDEMVRPQVKVDESTSWALGWQVLRTANGNVIQHEGGNTGFQAFTGASLERRRGYVLMTNSDNGWKVIQPVVREIT